MHRIVDRLVEGLNQKERARDNGAALDAERETRKVQTDGQSATKPRTTSFTRFARRARTSAASELLHLYRTAALSAFWSLILAFAVIVTPVVALSRILFNFEMGYGQICKPTPPKKLRWISATSPLLKILVSRQATSAGRAVSPSRKVVPIG